MFNRNYYLPALCRNHRPRAAKNSLLQIFGRDLKQFNDVSWGSSLSLYTPKPLEDHNQSSPLSPFNFLWKLDFMWPQRFGLAAAALRMKNSVLISKLISKTCFNKKTKVLKIYFETHFSNRLTGFEIIKNSTPEQRT